MAAPRESIRYKQPRRLNWFTALLLVGALAAGYWFWRFFPAHFDAWAVDHILKDSANACYKANRLAEPGRSEELRVIVEKAKKDVVKKVGIRDPQLLVNLNL